MCKKLGRPLVFALLALFLVFTSFYGKAIAAEGDTMQTDMGSGDNSGDMTSDEEVSDESSDEGDTTDEEDGGEGDEGEGSDEEPAPAH